MTNPDTTPNFKPRGPYPCFEVKYRAIPLTRKRVRHSTRGPLVVNLTTLTINPTRTSYLRMNTLKSIVGFFIWLFVLNNASPQRSQDIHPQDSLKPDNRLGLFINQTSFGAVLYKSNHTNADSFIRDLKESCKGNAIYIDIWATWCGPCLKELPTTKKLSLDVKDLPLSFVYLCTSTGTTTENWINKITDLLQPGIHILVDDDLLMKVVRTFDVGVYPGYVLIDANGVNKKDAIPQDGSVSKETLKKLISK